MDLYRPAITTLKGWGISVIESGETSVIPTKVAAAALLDLDSDADALVREALVAALAVDCGAASTPSGLMLVG